MYVSSTSSSVPSSSSFRVPTFFVTSVAPVPSLRSIACMAVAHAARAVLIASTLLASWLIPCAAKATPSMAPKTSGPLTEHVSIMPGGKRDEMLPDGSQLVSVTSL